MIDQDRQDRFIDALRGRAWEWGVVSTADLNFSPDVRAACERNVCGAYGANWSCPPANGSLEETRDRVLAFTRALVFTTRRQLDDTFDIEGMTAAGAAHDALVKDLQERFGPANPVYGAGGCRVCAACAYPEPCRFPARRTQAVEAAGINVTDLSRAAGVRYNNGEATVTYFGMILFNG